MKFFKSHKSLLAVNIKTRKHGKRFLFAVSSTPGKTETGRNA